MHCLLALKEVGWHSSVSEKHCALAQAIIGNYAVPVLEEKQVWGTSDDTRTAYLDSQVLPALLQQECS